MKIMRKFRIETEDFKFLEFGDQISIFLTGLGTFTASIHRITDKGVLFIFDEYITCRPMNGTNTNEGGFEASDLKKWIDTELIEAFPKELRNRITDISIPSVGELFGHSDAWNEEIFEPDTDKQILLMKERKNRVTYYNDKYELGWLRNATKKEVSASYFACASTVGSAGFTHASYPLGVRPEFWLKHSTVPNNRKQQAALDLEKQLADFVNVFGYDSQTFAEAVAREHKTLQQSIMRLFIITINKMSIVHPDERNQATVELAKIITEIAKDYPLPLI